MNTQKHIVFITPTLNRTGSEQVLFTYIKHISLSVKITLISKYKGPLYHQLPDFIEKYFLYLPGKNNLFVKLINRYRKLFVVNRILNKRKNALWYINTIVLPDMLQFAAEKNIPVIVHVHELAHMYSLLSTQQLNLLISYPKAFIANSEASDSVLKQLNSSVQSYICYPPLNEGVFKASKKEHLLRTYGVKPSEFVWMMGGTLDENKNPFLFVDIALSLSKKTNKFKMLWLGGSTVDESMMMKAIRYAKEKNMEEHVVFSGEVEDAYFDFISLANGFVLTSQYESFSMATLEALYFGLPVVANDCVGVREILLDEYGYIVKNKNNADEFSEAMLNYMNGKISVDKDLLRLRAMDFSAEKITEKWNVILNKFI